MGVRGLRFLGTQLWRCLNGCVGVLRFVRGHETGFGGPPGNRCHQGSNGNPKYLQVHRMVHWLVMRTRLVCIIWVQKASIPFSIFLGK